MKRPAIGLGASGALLLIAGLGVAFLTADVRGLAIAAIGIGVLSVAFLWYLATGDE